MNTKLAATQVRMTQWVAIIKDRCDSGVKVDDYCERHGFFRNAYFYWFRKVKEATLTYLLTQLFFNIIKISGQIES